MVKTHAPRIVIAVLVLSTSILLLRYLLFPTVELTISGAVPVFVPVAIVDKDHRTFIEGELRSDTLKQEILTRIHRGIRADLRPPRSLQLSVKGGYGVGHILVLAPQLHPIGEDRSQPTWGRIERYVEREQARLNQLVQRSVAECAEALDRQYRPLALAWERIEAARKSLKGDYEVYLTGDERHHRMRRFPTDLKTLEELARLERSGSLQGRALHRLRVDRFWKHGGIEEVILVVNTDEPAMLSKWIDQLPTHEEFARKQLEIETAARGIERKFGITIRFVSQDREGLYSMRAGLLADLSEALIAAGILEAGVTRIRVGASSNRYPLRSSRPDQTELTLSAVQSGAELERFLQKACKALDPATEKTRNIREATRIRGRVAQDHGIRLGSSRRPGSDEHLEDLRRVASAITAVDPSLRSRITYASLGTNGLYVGNRLTRVLVEGWTNPRTLEEGCAEVEASPLRLSEVLEKIADLELEISERTKYAHQIRTMHDVGPMDRLAALSELNEALTELQKVPSSDSARSMLGTGAYRNIRISNTWTGMRKRRMGWSRSQEFELEIPCDSTRDSILEGAKQLSPNGIQQELDHKRAKMETRLRKDRELARESN